MQTKIERGKGMDAHQFLWIVAGRGLFSVGGETVVLERGAGLFTRRDVPNAYEAVDGTFHTMWLTFAGGEALLDLCGVGAYLFFDAPDFLTPATIQLEALCHRTPSAMARSAHAYLWAVELLEAVAGKELTLAKRVDQLLERDYARPLTLAEIARQVDADKFALCRAYGAETGETVMRALRRVRVQKAKRFLRYSALSVEEIGRLCGFESASYFAKIFRGETSRTPTQYRRG